MAVFVWRVSCLRASVSAFAASVADCHQGFWAGGLRRTLLAGSWDFLMGICSAAVPRCPRAWREG